MTGEICLIEVFMGETLAGFSAVPMALAKDPQLAVKPVITRLNWYLWDRKKKQLVSKEGEKPQPGHPYFTAVCADRNPVISYDLSVAHIVELTLHFDGDLLKTMQCQMRTKGLEPVLARGEKACREFYKNSVAFSSRARQLATQRGIILPLPQVPALDITDSPSLIVPRR